MDQDKITNSEQPDSGNTTNTPLKEGDQGNQTKSHPVRDKIRAFEKLLLWKEGKDLETVQQAFKTLSIKTKPRKFNSRIIDRIYFGILAFCGLSVFLIIIGIFIELLSGSSESLHRFGFHFFSESNWDPNKETFGALPFILGTLYSSFWALVIAVPISLLTAIFLSELCPPKLYRPLSFLVELLAAIPSVVYGLWGLFVLQPFLVHYVEKPIAQNPVLSKIPIFGDTPNGYDMLSASIILSIMVLPYITAVSRDILRTIPKTIRDASYALGATKWQTIWHAVLPYARAGFIGSIILGLGRALGETMAVTMVIGNSPRFTASLFNSGYTMSSVIANELAEASGVYRSALIEIGLSLFIVTLIVNFIAKVLVFYTGKGINDMGKGKS